MATFAQIPLEILLEIIRAVYDPMDNGPLVNLSSASRGLRELAGPILFNKFTIRVSSESWISGERSMSGLLDAIESSHLLQQARYVHVLLASYATA